MALQINMTYKGLEAKNTYFKITNLRINEEGSNEGQKLYGVTIEGNLYSNETKEFILERKTIQLEGLIENELNLNNFYSKLKELADFKGAIDI